MKVLLLSLEDCAGVSYRYARALNRYIGSGITINAKSVSFVPTSLKYPIHVFRPSRDELRELVDWADVVHVFDRRNQWDELLEDKPVVVSYHGIFYRSARNALDKRDGDDGIVSRLCTTIDMTRYGLDLIPTPAPFELRDQCMHMMRFNRPDQVYDVSHSPTKFDRKGTRYVQDAEDALPHLKFDIIQRTPNDECVRRKALSRVFVEQIGPGIDRLGNPALAMCGMNVLEAWALGIPVITSVHDDFIDELDEAFDGEWPFLRCDKPGDLPGLIVDVLNDEFLRAVLTTRGFEHLRKCHAPAVVANQLRGIYERAIEAGV